MAMSLTVPGKNLTGVERMQQSIGLYFRTPKGSICYRPSWGFPIISFVDRNVTAVLDLIRETRNGLALWDPEIFVISVTPVFTPGQLTMKLKWRPVYTDSNIVIENEYIL